MHHKAEEENATQSAFGPDKQYSLSEETKMKQPFSLNPEDTPKTVHASNKFYVTN